MHVNSNNFIFFKVVRDGGNRVIENLKVRGGLFLQTFLKSTWIGFRLYFDVVDSVADVERMIIVIVVVVAALFCDAREMITPQHCCFVGAGT